MEQNPLMFTESEDNEKFISEELLTDFVDESLIDDIWRDLDGRIDRDQIREVATKVAREFVDATVTSFVPLFIRRRTYERLKLINE